MEKPTVSTLERALAEARRALGSPSDVERLRDKLGALPPAGAPASNGAPNGMGAGAKIAAGAAAGVLLITGAMLLPAREPSSAPRERAFVEPPRAIAPSPPAMPAPPSPSVEVAAPAAPPAEPAITTQRRKLAKPAAAIEAPLAAEQPSNGPTELQLLMSAQDAIEASPQRALGLLIDHARLYPSGSFAQERESLAIDTLRKLGRTTEARERARAFIARFPKASNVKHLTRWLGESSNADHNAQAQPLPTP